MRYLQFLLPAVLGVAAAAADSIPEAPQWADLQQKVEHYLELRKKLAQDVPKLPEKASPEQIRQHEQALAKAIRTARRDALQGDVFQPDIAERLTKVIQSEIKGPSNSAARKAVKQTAPKRRGAPANDIPRSSTEEAIDRVPVRVNAQYPTDAPVSTVPPSVLLRLPKLPEGLQYRFVGDALILHDMEANLIVDYIPGVAANI